MFARLEKLEADVDNTLAGLRTNIEMVKAKFEHIKEMREKKFWDRPEPELLAKIEEKRQILRGIIQYSFTVSPPPRPLPLILDIDDSDLHYAVRDKVRPSAQEMLEYRQRVREVLEPHVATAPSLRKIRRGDGLTEYDFDALTALTLTQNARVDLEILREFYPEMPQLQRELRAIVGMEADVVSERFAQFYHKYPSLSSLQVAFLNLLQKHIATYGPIHLEKLYEAPFTHISAEGPEGIFRDEDQLHDFFTVLQSFDNPKEAFS
jgi:type I restriction enzyme R subunit